LFITLIFLQYTIYTIYTPVKPFFKQVHSYNFRSWDGQDHSNPHVASAYYFGFRIGAEIWALLFWLLFTADFQDQQRSVTRRDEKRDLLWRLVQDNECTMDSKKRTQKQTKIQILKKEHFQTRVTETETRQPEWEQEHWVVDLFLTLVLFVLWELSQTIFNALRQKHKCGMSLAWDTSLCLLYYFFCFSDGLFGAILLSTNVPIAYVYPNIIEMPPQWVNLVWSKGLT